MEVWRGNLILNDRHSISDIHLSAAGANPDLVGPKTQLRFLAFVDTSRIPLNLIYGPKLDVWTDKEETQAWFSRVLLTAPQHDNDAEWWQTPRPESPLGVLTAVETAGTEDDARHDNITQVLFVAASSSSSGNAPPCPPTPPQSSQGTHNTTATATDPEITLSAFTLSSHLARASAQDATLPPSPACTDNHNTPIQATFLPDPFTQPPRPPKSTTATRKRKSISDTFTEADALRKRIRLKPGQSVQAASATGPSMPTLQELKTNALESRNTAVRPISSSGVPMQTRPLSRSSSISSLAGPRVGSRGGDRASDPTKRSGLARMQSVAVSSSATMENSTVTADAAAIETANRDIISRLVMAGMRLYGLSQSKSKISQQQQQQQQQQIRASIARPPIAAAAAAAATITTAPNSSPSPAALLIDDKDRQKDEEYKLIYHITFKGAVFAFRARMDKISLHPHMDSLRDVVDKLLGLYCVDVLAQGLSSGSGTGAGIGGGGGAKLAARVTPGGRKAFETPREEEEEGKGSPFAMANAAVAGTTTTTVGGGGGSGRRREGNTDEAITPTFRKRVKEKAKTESIAG